MSSVSPVTFPVDLSAEVPMDVFIDGYRARWVPPQIAGAEGRGVVEVLDLRELVHWNEYADTKAAAIECLDTLDWSEITDSDEPDDGDRPWMPSAEEMRGAV